MEDFPGYISEDDAEDSAYFTAGGSQDTRPQYCPGFDVPSLAEVYRDIHRRAPNARIVVLGYPKLFGGTNTSYEEDVENALEPLVGVQFPRQEASCAMGAFRASIGESDLYWLGNLADQLNTQIDSATEQLRSQGVDIEFAPSDPYFEGHRICDEKPQWINDVRMNGLDVDQRSFHPHDPGGRDEQGRLTTTDGQYAQYQAIGIFAEAAPQVTNLPVILTESLRDGTANQRYFAQLRAASGTPPYVWSVSGLPGWLEVDSANGTLSGTATSAGSYEATVSLTDGSGRTTNKRFDLSIRPSVEVNASPFTVLERPTAVGIVRKMWPARDGSWVYTIDPGNHEPLTYRRVDATGQLQAEWTAYMRPHSVVAGDGAHLYMMARGFGGTPLVNLVRIGQDGPELVSSDWPLPDWPVDSLALAPDGFLYWYTSFQDESRPGALVKLDPDSLTEVHRISGFWMNNAWLRAGATGLIGINYRSAVWRINYSDFEDIDRSRDDRIRTSGSPVRARQLQKSLGANGTVADMTNTGDPSCGVHEASLRHPGEAALLRNVGELVGDAVPDCEVFDLDAGPDGGGVFTIRGRDGIYQFWVDRDFGNGRLVRIGDDGEGRSLTTRIGPDGVAITARTIPYRCTWPGQTYERDCSTVEVVVVRDGLVHSHVRFDGPYDESNVRYSGVRFGEGQAVLDYRKRSPDGTQRLFETFTYGPAVVDGNERFEEI